MAQQQYNSTSPIAVAADFADAMLIARHAKNWIVTLLLVMLLMQITLFFLVRFNVIDLRATGAQSPSAPAAVEVIPSTQPSTATASVTAAPAEVPSADGSRAQTFRKMLQYLTGLINFLGIVLIIVLAVMLLLMINIMLLGRLIGISSVTSAFVWCVLLTALLFPWQAFLNNQGLTPAEATFKLPGVLYTWEELVSVNRDFDSQQTPQLILKWSRFVAFPILAIALLLAVHAKSKRGLRQALGESNPADAVSPMDLDLNAR